MLNESIVGKYFRLSGEKRFFRVDHCYLKCGGTYFSGYVLDAGTAKIFRNGQLTGKELIEEVSDAEVNAVICQLSMCSGLSICF